MSTVCDNQMSWTLMQQQQDPPYGGSVGMCQNLLDDLIRTLLGETFDKKRNNSKQGIFDAFCVAARDKALYRAACGNVGPTVAHYSFRFLHAARLSNHAPLLSAATRHNAIKYGAFVRGAVPPRPSSSLGWGAGPPRRLVRVVALTTIPAGALLVENSLSGGLSGFLLSGQLTPFGQ